jgi:hypothetical protein
LSHYKRKLAILVLVCSRLRPYAVDEAGFHTPRGSLLIVSILDYRSRDFVREVDEVEVEEESLFTRDVGAERIGKISINK